MAYHWFSQENLSSRSWNTGDGVLTREPSCIALRKLNVGGEPRNVNIRLVESFEKVQAACDLINDRYAWRGYGANHRIPSGFGYTTFTAEIDDEVVGTITLAVDSESGLAADACFRAEMDQFRESGAKICELTKFAFSATIHSKELMAALFHIVFVYGHRTFGCTDLFIEVNPRHVRFYEAMLGFQRVGSLKVNDSVSAPAQLMRLEVAAIRDYINRAAGNPERLNARSLYPFFFSPAEESGIYRRLTEAGRKIVSAPADSGTEDQHRAPQPAPSMKAAMFEGLDKPRKLSSAKHKYGPMRGVVAPQDGDSPNPL